MSKPWPRADYCTPGVNSNGNVVLQLFRREDEDGEGWHTPIAEVVIHNPDEFIAMLKDVVKHGD